MPGDTVLQAYVLKEQFHEVKLDTNATQKLPLELKQAGLGHLLKDERASNSRGSCTVCVSKPVSGVAQARTEKIEKLLVRGAFRRGSPVIRYLRSSVSFMLLVCAG